MITDIAFFRWLGLPLVAWCGYLGLAGLLMAAMMPSWNSKMTRWRFPFNWHRYVAAIGLTLAIIHALMYKLA